MPAATTRFAKLSLLALAIALASPLAAAQQRPPNLQPVPEPPPPPRGYELDSAVQPEITIRKRGQEVVEEYRIGGRLYMMKITPPGGGTPYYLIDHTGDGRFIRESAQDPGVRPPMWVIHSW
ncbi:MAG: DUF2782 domain-containing protein [Betaproteobacteria bacterium]|nr:DUF2782 domain-containing protein [Betaproteobacteria bacterium]